MKIIIALLLSTSMVLAKHNDEDVETPQSLIDAYYETISGPIGEQRDFDRFRNLFHPQARLIYSYWNQQSQKAELMIFNTEEFIEKLDYLDKKGFYEFELYNRIEKYNTITQAFSTYEYKTEDKTIAGRGITSYELFYDGNRYWIMSMFWVMEDDKHTIPEVYLPK